MEIINPSDRLTAETAAEAFAALGSASRIGVMTTLVEAGPSGLATGALGARCGIGGSTLTHHIRALARAGLIEQHRQGRHIVCAANYDRVRALSGYLLAQCCAAESTTADPEKSHG